MASFAGIPLRSNGETIDASWFNTIRNALITLLGDASGEVPQSIGDADTDQDIADLVFDKALFSRIDVKFWVRRETDNNELCQSGTFELHYKKKTNEWFLREGPNRGDDALISFSLHQDTSGGGNVVTVRYSTTTMADTGHEATITTRWEAWVA